MGEIGHTFTGFVLFNLPLVTFVYFIYHIFVHQISIQSFTNLFTRYLYKKVDSLLH